MMAKRSTPRTAFGRTLQGVICVWMLAAHAGEVMDRISATRISAAAKVVKARCGADGTVHLLFDTADGPYYANSTDGGLTFRPPIAVVDAAAQKAGLSPWPPDLFTSGGEKTVGSLWTFFSNKDLTLAVDGVC